MFLYDFFRYPSSYVTLFATPFTLIIFPSSSSESPAVLSLEDVATVCAQSLRLDSQDDGWTDFGECRPFFLSHSPSFKVEAHPA